MLLCDSRDPAMSPPFGLHSRTQQRQNLPYNALPTQPQQQLPGPRPSDQRFSYGQRGHRNSGDLSATYTGFGSNAADLEIPFPHQKRVTTGATQISAGNPFPGPYGSAFTPPIQSFGVSASKLPPAPGLDPPGTTDHYRKGPWLPASNQKQSGMPRQRSFGHIQPSDTLALEWPGNEKNGSPILPTTLDIGNTNLPTTHGKKEGRPRPNMNIPSSPPKTNPYNNHRKARKTGEVDDLYYYLDYDRRGSPQSNSSRLVPELETTLEADEQDRIFQKLNDYLSNGMFNFFAKHQFPIPIDPGKRRVRKASDREWHEWLELAIALCEKRMIPKTLLHNERIKEFVTILQNSGEIRHVVAHPSRPLKSDMGVFQLISAGIHVAQIIKDWDGMEDMLKVKENTEAIIAKRRRRRESIKKHVRFLEQYAESEGLD